MVAPDLFAGDIHAFLALTGCSDDDTIDINDRFMEKRLGLLPPDVQSCLVIAKQLEMFQPSSPAQHVQHMGHHMIGFPVRRMHFQQLDSPFNCIHKPGVSRQLHHHADSTMIDRMSPLRQCILDRIGTDDTRRI